MCFVPIILTTELSLGRVDLSSFSDQTLMEMLIDGFDESSKKMYQHKDGEYLDVCEWCSVKCDSDERVVEISECLDVSGSLQLAYIPPKVRELIIPFQQLKGSFDFAYVPRSMEFLSLDNNRLTGTLNLEKLPPNIRIIHLHGNQLSGSLRFDTLPAKMRNINVSNNRFTGQFVATNLPPVLALLNAKDNHFSAIAVVDSETEAFINLSGSGVTSVIDENGNLNVKRVCI